jgi:hypothetical protein
MQPPYDKTTKDATSCSVRWDTLERIAVDGYDRKAILLAWFHPSHQPTSEWMTRYRVQQRGDGSYAIYAPASLEMVMAGRLRYVLPQYAGHLYDGPDPGFVAGRRSPRAGVSGAGRR